MTNIATAELDPISVDLSTVKFTDRYPKHDRLGFAYTTRSSVDIDRLLV